MAAMAAAEENSVDTSNTLCYIELITQKIEQMVS